MQEGTKKETKMKKVMKLFLLNVSSLQTYRQICCKFTSLSSNELVRVYTIVINRIYRPFELEVCHHQIVHLMICL